MNPSEKTLYHLIEKYYDDVFKYCRRHLNQEEDAYDITQSVFLSFTENYQHIEPEHVQSWLFVTAKHKIIDLYRERGKEKEFFADHIDVNMLTDDEEFSYTMFASLADTEIDEIKRHILSLLSDNELTLYKERFDLNMDYAELAEKYHTTEETMRKRVSRLRVKIIKSLQVFLYLLCLAVTKQ